MTNVTWLVIGGHYYLTMPLKKTKRISVSPDSEVTREPPSKIRHIRGFHVILDKDLAELYQVKPIRLREQVKRNLERFPEDFMFQLNENEVDLLVSQNAIASRKQLGGSLPYVFTEQGVAGLSGVLTGPRAVRVHVSIMRAFVEMRKLVQNNAGVFLRLDGVEKRQIAFESETERKFDQILDALGKSTEIPRQGIFYEGQVYDAYVFVSRLIRGAKESVVLIDNYVDETVLTLLGKRDRGVRAVIFTKAISRTLALDLKKHNAQYPPIEIREFAQSHDRFLILDRHTIYHIGASLKDLGKKWFAFSRLEKGALHMLERLGETA